MTEVVQRADEVTLTIDGVEVTAPKGSLIIRVAERLGIEVPRFCDHPLLEPVGACRQCLVEVEGQRKPITCCTTPIADGMVVKTHLSSEVARAAQEGIMEFLLINHPLDCPVCDKGGECPLQNQAMSTGRPTSRFVDVKRTFRKPINLSTQVLLDRERCVQCARCTRFSEQIAGDPFIELMDRTSDEQVNVYREDMFGGEPGPEGSHSDLGAEPLRSYFSGNTIQICPVGALTSADYRFRARPFDLVSTPSVCEHCAAGCAQRTDHRRGKVMRRLAGDDPAVNEEWDCDKGRFGFRYATAYERITEPLLRDPTTGELRPAAWSEALAAAADGLRAARDEAGGVGVLTGGRLTVEDAYAYSKFARIVLRTNDLDFRARPASAEEADFLAAAVVGQQGPTYSDVEQAPAVVLAGLEPEQECPILFLRLRKARRKGMAGGGSQSLVVHALAPYRTRGLAKLGATVRPCLPGAEAEALAGDPALAGALRQPGALLLVGERLATVPGGLSAAAELAERTGARLAWVPRRAGERGALEAGCLPHLLPGGRPVTEPRARAELAGAWELAAGVLDSRPGRDTTGILAAAAAGDLGALVVAGVDPGDLADPRAAERALDAVPFLVSLEQRHSAVTRRADVVLPVAPVVEKAGSFLTWEGRLRPFETVLDTGALTDGRILDALAGQFGVALGCRDVSQVRAELAGPSFSATAVPRPAAPQVAPVPVPQPAGGSAGSGQALLATWHQLIDQGTLLAGDEALAGTAPPSVVRLGKELATRLRVADGDPVTVGTPTGALTLPAEVTGDLPDGVVWLPTNSPGATVRRTLGVTAGALVDVSPGIPRS